MTSRSSWWWLRSTARSAHRRGADRSRPAAADRVECAFGVGRGALRGTDPVRLSPRPCPRPYIASLFFLCAIVGIGLLAGGGTGADAIRRDAAVRPRHRRRGRSHGVFRQPLFRAARLRRDLRHDVRSVRLWQWRGTFLMDLCYDRYHSYTPMLHRVHGPARDGVPAVGRARPLSLRRTFRARARAL